MWETGTEHIGPHIGPHRTPSLPPPPPSSSASITDCFARGVSKTQTSKTQTTDLEKAADLENTELSKIVLVVHTKLTFKTHDQMSRYNSNATEYVTFKENPTKTRQGGLNTKHRSLLPKIRYWRSEMSC